MPGISRISRSNFSDPAPYGFFSFVLLVRNRLNPRNADDRRDCNVRDVLPGCASICWNGDTLTSICLLADIHAGVLSAVGAGLRRMAERYADGVCADSVWSVTCATFDTT